MYTKPRHTHTQPIDVVRHLISWLSILLAFGCVCTIRCSQAAESSSKFKFICGDTGVIIHAKPIRSHFPHAASMGRAASFFNSLALRRKNDWKIVSFRLGFAFGRTRSAVSSNPKTAFSHYFHCPNATMQHCLPKWPIIQAGNVAKYLARAPNHQIPLIRVRSTAQSVAYR